MSGHGIDRYLLDPRSPAKPEELRQSGLDRRRFLQGGLGGVAALAVAPAAQALAPWAAKPVIDAQLRTALEESPLIYVSPLRADGQESHCHAEVWFAWIDGEAVVTVSSEGWKSRAIDRGLDQARIWVGDFGRWKGLVGHNEAFRRAPSFRATAQKSRDESLLERLLASYDRKYPAEIARWRDAMRKGNEDGSRALIRYRPVERT